MDIEKALTDEEIKKQYDQYKDEAEELLKNHDKLKVILHETEQKLKKIPLIGDDLKSLISMVDMLRAYVKKEYTVLPKSSLISIIAVLAYIVSPIDLIPDAVPIIGFVDDAFIIKLALESGIKKDLDKYTEWRETNGK